MNRIDQLRLDIEKAELELENIDSLEKYNVYSEAEAKLLINEDIDRLKVELQDELNKPTYYDIYGTD